MPGPLRWMGAAVGVLVLVLLALPVVMSLDRDLVTTSVLRDDPSRSGDELDTAITMVLGYTWALHVVYAAVVVWLSVKTLRGRRWARIALSVLMVLATANSIESAMAGQEYYWAVIAGDVLHISVLVLLWVPKSVRAYFGRKA